MALLDMVFGFADLVTLSPLAFCRPEVTANGPMTIRRGRHPIVGAVQDCKFVPNDIHMRWVSGSLFYHLRQFSLQNVGKEGFRYCLFSSNCLITIRSICFKSSRLRQ